MKKTILIYIVVLLFSGMIKLNAQCTLLYKPISMFNDTESFVNYNFSDRADCYKDKTLVEVMADLKLPIKSFICLDSDENGTTYDGIYIFLAPYDYIRYQELFKGKFFSCISIIWKTPRNLSEIEPLLRTIKVNWTNWTPEVENLLKNIPIERVGSVKR